MNWLHRAWRYFDRQPLRAGGTQPWSPVRPHPTTAEFLATFGVNSPGPAKSSDTSASSRPSHPPNPPPPSSEHDQGPHGSDQEKGGRDARQRAVFPEAEEDIQVDTEPPRLCGLHAVNAILQAFDLPHITRELMDVYSKRCSSLEEFYAPGERGAAAYHCNTGNYSIEVILRVLEVQGVGYTRTRVGCKWEDSAYLVGTGAHWFVITHTDEDWVLWDGGHASGLRATQAFQMFLQHRESGAVYAAFPPPTPPPSPSSPGTSTLGIVEELLGNSPPTSPRAPSPPPFPSPAPSSPLSPAKPPPDVSPCPPLPAARR
mmetsp:Transcript_102056/g.176232  ORF Transcript_102056/g.176232 Transcript_102056/m.176232 type:complete len:315 (-) Transcript_102056:15-959(-)